MNALTCEEQRLRYETKAKKENLAKFIEEIGVVETVSLHEFVMVKGGQ